MWIRDYLWTLAHGDGVPGCPMPVTRCTVPSPPPKVYLVLELMDQDLSSLMRSRVNGLSGIVLRSYLHQMLDALSYCHGHRVLHRDLKPRHVLVSRDMQTVKLSGFSLSRCFSLPLHTYTHEVVTLWYRAPEVLLGDMHYGPALDVWSLGCIFAEMATKRVLFPGDSEIDELFKIFRLLGTPDERNWPGVAALPDWSDVFPPWRPQPLGTALGPALDSEALDLLAKMLRHDPSERIPAKAALQHPYFASLEAQEA